MKKKEQKHSNNPIKTKKKESDISSFNRYKILRNRFVYGGERISEEKCKESLNFLLEFLPKIEKEYNILVKKE